MLAVSKILKAAMTKTLQQALTNAVETKYRKPQQRNSPNKQTNKTGNIKNLIEF